MRIKLPSGKVWEGTPEQILHRLHQTSEPLKGQTFRAYLDGVVERLRPVKVWLDVPPQVKTGSDESYAQWLGSELLKVKRWSETTEPTEEEKEVAKARAAEEAKAKAAAAAAAKAAAPAPTAPAATAAKPPA